MYAHDNPFRASRIEALPYQFSNDSWPAFMRRLAINRFRGAIVGPHGSGKSTLLDELYFRLLADGHRTCISRLHTWKRSFSEEDWHHIGKAQIVMLDGAEQLSYLNWIRFKKRVGRHRGIIITSHSDGWLPAIYRCRTDEALLENLLKILNQNKFVISGALHELYIRHNGNLREVFSSLYDNPDQLQSNAAR